MAIKKRYPPLELENDQQVLKERQVKILDQPRNEKGRYVKRRSLKSQEELQLKSDRPIMLVKVNGSYGTYKVKEKMFTDFEKFLMFAAGTLFLITL